MKKSAAAREEAALEIRFGPVDIAQVCIMTTDPGAIVDELTGRVATAPRFFDQAAVGLELSRLTSEPGLDEIRAVIQAVQRAGMLPIGLVRGPSFVESLAQRLGLPVLPPQRPRSNPVPLVRADESREEHHALIHDRHVRSGQRVYARERDLIVTAAVGAGAEVIADGCVHIYGSLRGRAMAGVRGNVSARVFCQEFRAELVSIAGVFRVFETLPAELAGLPAQAWLEGEDLRFAPIGNPESV